MRFIGLFILICFPLFAHAHPPLCGQNGENPIDVTKYDDRGDNYRWVSDFLNRLNSFYKYDIELESIGESAQQLVRDGVDIPEVDCVLNGIKNKTLERDIQRYKSDLASKAQAEEKEQENSLLSGIKEINNSTAALDACIKKHMTHRDSEQITSSCINNIAASVHGYANDLGTDRNIDEISLIREAVEKFDQAAFAKQNELSQLAKELPPLMFKKRCAFNVCTGEPIHKYADLMVNVDQEVFNKNKRLMAKNLAIEKAVTGSSSADLDTATYSLLAFVDRVGLDLISRPEMRCTSFDRMSAIINIDGNTLFLGISRINLPDRPLSYWGITSIRKKYPTRFGTPEYYAIEKELRKENPDLITSMMDDKDDAQATASLNDYGDALYFTIDFGVNNSKNFISTYDKGCKPNVDI